MGNPRRSVAPPRPTLSLVTRARRPLHGRYLDNIPDDTITGVDVPTGVPLLYEFDEEMKPIPQANAAAPLSGRYCRPPLAVPGLLPVQPRSVRYVQVPH
jgi:hypothetical protein